MPMSPYDPTTSAQVTAIVRSAVIVTTVALFVGAMLNMVLGQRDIAVIMALGAPLGISALGFMRAGHNEAAMGLLCVVLITIITLILMLNPLGVHDMAVTAYGGVILFGAMLFSRRSFIAITGLTIFAASAAFYADLNGHSRSVIDQHSAWPQYAAFILIVGVFAYLGRSVSEKLFGSLGEAHVAAKVDGLTGLLNRAGFLVAAAMRLRAAHDKGESAVLVIADLDGFRRANLVVGHGGADNLLREGTRRLLAECGGDLIARIGDDEFAVLRIAIHETHAAEFARVVHQALTFDYLGVSVRSTAGWARFPRDANGIESLLMAAESGITHSKADPKAERVSGPADRI